MRAYENRIGISDFGCHFVAFARQLAQPLDRDVIQCEYLVHVLSILTKRTGNPSFQPLAFSNSAMNSISLSTASSLTAL